MGRVRWTRESERWLREIHDYVKDGGDVDILGIFHGALDIHRYLR